MSISIASRGAFASKPPSNIPARKLESELVGVDRMTSYLSDNVPCRRRMNDNELIDPRDTGTYIEMRTKAGSRNRLNSFQLTTDPKTDCEARSLHSASSKSASRDMLVMVSS